MVLGKGWRVSAHQFDDVFPIIPAAPAAQGDLLTHQQIPMDGQEPVQFLRGEHDLYRTPILHVPGEHKELTVLLTYPSIEGLWDEGLPGIGQLPGGHALLGQRLRA